MGLSSKCTTKTVQSALCNLILCLEYDLEISLLKGLGLHARKIRVWLEDQTTPEYLTGRDGTQSRAKPSWVFPPSTQSKLPAPVNRNFYKGQGPLINHDQSGLRCLLAEDRNEDLRRMFNLFRRLADGLSPMALMTKKFVQMKNKLLRNVGILFTLKSKGEN